MRIQSKVFLTLLTSSIILVLLMMQLVQWSLDRGLLEYINQKQLQAHQPLVNALESDYEEQGSWDKLRDKPRIFEDLVKDNLTRQRNGPSPRPDEDFAPPTRGDEKGSRPPHKRNSGRKPPPPQNKLALLDLDRRSIAGKHKNFKDALNMPLQNSGQTVGWLSIANAEPLANGYELQLMEQQREALILAGLAVLALAFFSSLLFSPSIVKPIKAIANRTKALIEGKSGEPLDSHRSDELGDLARGVDHLAETLASNEQMRQRWLADTSHELRTPLAIIKGEIEAMLDGIRPVNREQIESISQEVNHLQKLINDLTDLSNTNIGGLRLNMAIVDLNELMLSKEKRFISLAQNAELKVEIKTEAEELLVWGDEVRLHQMIDNLVTNSFKYTDSGGEISIKLYPDNNTVMLTIEDSLPGVSSEALPHLFEYLYRVESSRNRKTGGSGLGLAIAEGIALGHGGNIVASHSLLGGLKMVVNIPTMSDEQ
jgi:two-component system sensor histidine kinase BaeS